MAGSDHACPACLRRTRLLALLAPHVERVRRRLPQLLALDDDALLASIGGRRRSQLAATLDRSDPCEDAARIAAAGLSARCRHSPRYPSRLLAAADAPALLTVAGDPANLDRLAGDGVPAIAVVGARRATRYGLEVARSLGRSIASTGIPVVSGLALGIDAAAHDGAVSAGGRAIAVLAGGADRPYPVTTAGVYRRILASGGCVVSEMPPGHAPFKWGFPARNRIIAGLADLTIVVEAASRSGSLITAELAQELGRLVGAVPGPVTSPTSTGANALLADGAHLIRDAQDALDALLGPGTAVVAGGPDPTGLDAWLANVLDRLGAEPTGLSQLTGPGDEVDEIVAALAELELQGFARRLPGGTFIRLAA